jgi:HEAT repeat protein
VRAAHADAKEATAAPAPVAPPPTATLEQVKSRFREVISAGTGLTPAGPAGFQLTESIKQLGSDGLFFLLEQLGTEDSRQRALASQLLGQLNSPEAIKSLGDTAVTDKDTTVAAVASQALALMDSPETVEELRRLAASPNGPATEINSIYGLCKHADPEGVKLAMAYLQNPEKTLQEKSILVVNLAKLPQPAILPVIDLAVPLFASSPAPVIQAVIQYYASLSSKDGQARLQVLAQNRALPEEVRGAAAAALANPGGSAPQAIPGR